MGFSTPSLRVQPFALATEMGVVLTWQVARLRCEPGVDGAPPSLGAAPEVNLNIECNSILTPQHEWPIKDGNRVAVSHASPGGLLATVPGE